MFHILLQTNTSCYIYSYKPIHHVTYIVIKLLQAHCSVERACMLGAVKCHLVVSDDKEQMRGDALMKAIQEDKQKGLIPFYVSFVPYYLLILHKGP